MNIIIKTAEDFEKSVFNNMTFKPFPMKGYTLYKNEARPDLGYMIKYERKNYYSVLVGDYTICDSFSLSFSLDEDLIRFGTVYSGESSFEIEDNPPSIFSPSSFFTYQSKINGIQFWKKGQHFQGVEITIHKKYFEDLVSPLYKDAIPFNSFIPNYTYNYLPLEMLSIIQSIKRLNQNSNLTLLNLESKILSCLCCLYEEINNLPKNAINYKGDNKSIKIGSNRFISLTSSDFDAIERAHSILTKSACNPPTIKALSKEVFLNEQKLKVGFSTKYHMSIGQYTASIRMAMAEKMLTTTEMTIDEIAKSTGYVHVGSFINKFKKAHGKTPLAFRKQH